MDGDGPIMGQPRHAGYIAMSQDVVAADATCCRLIGLNPERLEYLAEAGRFLGNVDQHRIEQRGERIDRYAAEFDVVEAFKPFRLTR
jgi:uncharacterized protein (DUF362 family)